MNKISFLLVAALFAAVPLSAQETLQKALPLLQKNTRTSAETQQVLQLFRSAKDPDTVFAAGASLVRIPPAPAQETVPTADDAKRCLPTCWRSGARSVGRGSSAGSSGASGFGEKDGWRRERRKEAFASVCGCWALSGWFLSRVSRKKERKTFPFPWKNLRRGSILFPPQRRRSHENGNEPTLRGIPPKQKNFGRDGAEGDGRSADDASSVPFDPAAAGSESAGLSEVSEQLTGVEAEKEPPGDGCDPASSSR